MKTWWRSKAGRTRARRARASLACGAISVLALMAGFAFTLETIKPQWRDPEFGHRLDRLNQLHQENPEQSFVLALGTSRTQNAIHPAAAGFLDDAASLRLFNFGQSGSSPLKVLLTLLRLLDRGIRPAAIIVEVLPVWLTLDGAAEDQFREYVPQLSNNDLGHLIPYCNNPGTLRGRWLAARAAPWHAQRVSLMSHWFPHWMPWQSRIAFQWQTMDRYGYTPYLHADPSPEFRAAAAASTRGQYAGSFGGFRLSALSMQSLHDIAAKCRNEQIPIAFFVPPVAPMFRNWFDTGVWQRGDQDLERLCRDLGVELFPALEQFTDQDFADGHHMLRHSAERYSRCFAETCLKKWLARNRQNSLITSR